MGEIVIHEQERFVFDSSFAAQHIQDDILSTIKFTTKALPVLNLGLLHRNRQFVAGGRHNNSHMFRLTLWNGDIVLLRGSLEDMNLNAQRHLDNGLGQIHRLDNARVLKNAGLGKRTQSKKKNKDTLQEWHDSRRKRVASDEAKRREKSAGKWDPHEMISNRHLILAILLLLTVACGNENKKKVGLL